MHDIILFIWIQLAKNTTFCDKEEMEESEYFIFQPYLKDIFQSAADYLACTKQKIPSLIFYSMNKKHKSPSSEQTELYDRITKIQTKIIDKVTVLKKEKPRCDCKHFENPRLPCENYDPSIDYYQKFWKCFLLNELCYARLKDAQGQLDQLEGKIKDVEQLFSAHDELTEGKGAKRLRRQAHELEKQFACPYPRCFKNYGAQIALNLHIKLKHNGGNKTERQRAAELICHARQHNLPAPIIYINLPPGFIEEYARSRHADSHSHNQPIYQDID